jgi:N4-(beta-N-acetylglucosaminyl)-L-asparaginase
MRLMPRLNRRQFLKTGAAAGLLAGARPGAIAAAGRGPAMVTSRPAVPIVISSENGHQFKNGGPRTAVEEAFRLLTTEGSDVIDALIAGVNLNELDPLETSVGYGGLPNADGVVQLDASCMHGALRRGGGVACLEGVRTPSKVARAVMDRTDHHLLAGAGAQAFAREMGFTIEADLNTDESRRQWLDWKRRLDPEHWVDPARAAAKAAERARAAMVAEGRLDPWHLHGTINCNGLNSRGEMAGVVTTSGLAFKIPGRVGDSPILGAGLYVDGEVGAAGSTGRGEANLYGLGSYQIVENLRLGLHPKDAGMDVVKRIVARTTEKRLLTESGQPRLSVKFYILGRSGEHAGVSVYSSYRGKAARYAVCSAEGARFLPCESLLGDAPKDA